MNAKINEGKLISGKDALIALANGEDVEYTSINGWNDVKHLHAYEFLSAGYEFRLKPRTITINGIEVPARGQNYQYGDAMYILNSLEPEEYSMVVLDQVDEVPAYWWRTEEEIQQVVAALRQVFGGSHDN